MKTAVEGAAEIYLSGVDRDAFAMLDRDTFAMLDRSTASAVHLEWSAAGATVTLMARGASTQFKSRAATLHEPRPELDQGLPLVILDEAARRFWRRVFLIARLPGGRPLLRWIAQRTRKG